MTLTRTGRYYFLPLTAEEIRWYKSLCATEWCDVCDSALIDKAGRVRSKGPIWQYMTSPNGVVIGLLHRKCCYTQEYQPGDNDPMIGKHPLEWGAWTAPNVTLND